MDLIVSEKARAQGVTTKVSIVATVSPTTRDPAICSQKLEMKDPELNVLTNRSMLKPNPKHNSPPKQEYRSQSQYCTSKSE